MDTLGSFDQELQEHIKFAVTRVLHNWSHSLDERDDLVQEVWTWYLARPSTQAIVAREGNNKTFIRNIFYKGAQQLISTQVTKSTEPHYSADAVKDWLTGKSTNKALGKYITKALDKLREQNPDQHQAILDRYERNDPVFNKPGAKAMLLSRAVRSLTEKVNEEFGEAQEDDPKGKKRESSQRAEERRRQGDYSDTTPNMAFAMIASGDDEIELQDGGTVTIRELFEEETLPIGPGTTGGRSEWVDLFEGEVNDRTDMYRAQVFPEMYPNEKPMLLQNWHPEDLAAYVGGEYTPGYRRLRVVK